MKTQAAKAASQIKKELKSQFPDTKFSVTSDTYSGGSSIQITYKDGPTKQKVQSIANYWVAGHFNGMIDLYEYDSGKDDRPTAKYVFVNREMGYEIAEKLEAEMRDLYDQPDIPKHKSFKVNGYFTDILREMRRRYEKISLVEESK